MAKVATDHMESRVEPIISSASTRPEDQLKRDLPGSKLFDM